ncbi:hypothetical protein [Rhodoferax ferrireducens]|uniref:hypothetical protein n=1 Tax=Rhodoferax ferrireducens TaxID=192843 RepID=UPI000E0D749E|nr:hypothetical protein [Rhodoferax ferrireducens]
MRQKPAIYVLPHGIEVIGEYPARGKNRYWRVRIRPHPFFPDAPVVSNGIYVRRNRVVLASKLGRALTPEEHAHHDDEDRDNDTADNVESLSPSEHNRHHKTGSTHRSESKAKTSATLKGLYQTGAMVPRPVIGSKQWCAKLTEEQAGRIKHSTEKTGVLVARYGVSKTVIKQIRNGKIWKHIT